jgi:hypothetical protein
LLRIGRQKNDGNIFPISWKSGVEAKEMSIQKCFLDPSKESELWPKCQSVICHEHFRLHLPQQSLICIFDLEERSEFIYCPWIGANYCGFTQVTSEPGPPGLQWPEDLIEIVWNNQGPRFDVVIYLRRRTCEFPVGTLITFAHELQHSMQRGFSRKVMYANSHLQDLSWRLGEELPTWRFPHEYEAQLASKRVAESILGKDEVQRYAQQQIELNSDPGKWEFFLSLDVLEPLNLLQRTIPWVHERREALKKEFELSRWRDGRCGVGCPRTLLVV